MQELSETCRRAGVLFAPHDNYIDFYPDADGFSYEKHIAFQPDGRPVRAWLNEGRKAQSYRYRPESIAEFLRPQRGMGQGQAGAHGLFHRRLVQHQSVRLLDVRRALRHGDFHAGYLGRAFCLDSRTIGQRRPANFRSRTRPVDRLPRRRADQPPARGQAHSRAGTLGPFGTSTATMPSGSPGSTRPITTASSATAPVIPAVTKAAWTRVRTGSIATTTRPPKC